MERMNSWQKDLNSKEICLEMHQDDGGDYIVCVYLRGSEQGYLSRQAFAVDALAEALAYYENVQAKLADLYLAM